MKLPETLNVRTAIILSIGNELISGQTVDTNSAYLSKALNRRGIFVSEHRTLGDDQTQIALAIQAASRMAELVLVTGGLGPTEDDLTRYALAEAMGTELVLDDPSLAEITEFFRSRNREMTNVNRVQAMIPRSTVPLCNPLGTAPGMATLLNEAWVFVLPGVPWEMQRMLEDHLLSRLKTQENIILHRIVHTFGRGESDIGEAIADLMRRDADPIVGTTVAAGMVSIRVLSSDKTEALAQKKAQRVIDEIRHRLGITVVGEEDDTMADVVGRLLRQRGKTLAVAESCTGGLIGKMLTDASGSSDYFRGGVIAYANDLKRDLLGVNESLLIEHGAVSEPVAQAMAEGIRLRAGADYALSVTGIAGPTGGTQEKPVGLVYIALAAEEGTQVFRHLLPGTREIVRLRVALTALDHLRQKLCE